MAMVIGTNVASITAQRHLANTRADMETSMERLSSGKRINSAMDDAAGMAIAHKLESKITGLDQAVRNANDGISLIGVAEGALDEIGDMLNRMKELATQAVNGTYTSDDRTAMNNEFVALVNEIDRIHTKTDFNSVSVLNATSSVLFQVGDSTSDTISLTLQDMGKASIGGGADAVVQAATAAVTTVATGAAEVSTQTMAARLTADKTLTLEIEGQTLTQAWDSSDALTLSKMAAQIQALGSVATAVAGDGSTAAKTLITITAASANDALVMGALTEVTPGGNISTQTITTAALAATAITNVEEAIKDVDSYRSVLGSVGNQLDYTVANLLSRWEHQAAAQSRIEDADFATESAALAKAQVLQQAGTAMLAQANASTQSVLSLLK